MTSTRSSSEALALLHRAFDPGVPLEPHHHRIAHEDRDEPDYRSQANVPAISDSLAPLHLEDMWSMAVVSFFLASNFVVER